jgi:hypothetical protein
LIQKGLDSQAQLWAYVDDFRYLALLCALCIPIAFFFKKPDPGQRVLGRKMLDRLAGCSERRKLHSSSATGILIDPSQ